MQLALAGAPPTSAAHRIDAGASPPVLDGHIDDAVWQRATRISDFHQIRPSDGGPPSEQTEVRVVYDDDYIYIAISAFDSEPDRIIAKGLVQGQTFFSDDRVEVRLDTFNDRRNAYFFQVNPNGLRREALVGNDYFIEDWDTVWDAAAQFQPWGWSAEMAIPTTSISFDPAIDTWGFNISRIISRKNEEVSWASRERSLVPAVSGYLTSIEGLQQGLGVELVPSLTLSDDNPQISPSLTAFYQPTPFMTAALTLNTDFSDTEADDRQVNLSRFSLFFPEKRDFFLQDAGIFEFGGLTGNARPFFSRRIGLSRQGEPLDLDAGLKLTGRAGDWNIGALAVRQQPGIEGGSEDLFVSRATRNILSESSVGAMVTSGDPLSAADNRLYGLDMQLRDSDFRDGKNLQFYGWLQQSDTEGLSGDQSAYGGRVRYPNDRFNWSLTYRNIEENFNPALGFVNRVGVRELSGEWSFRQRREEGRFQWLRSRVQFFRSEHLDGTGLQSESAYINVWEASTRAGDFITTFAGRERENLLASFEIWDGIVIPPGLYSFNRHGFFIDTADHHQVSGTLEVVDGDFFGGSNLTVVPGLDWRPNEHVRIGGLYVFADIDLPQGDFISRLYQLRVDLAFNSRWAWLNLIQADNDSDTLGFNSRLRWQPSPRLEMFLVLNQLSQRKRFDPFETSFAFKINYRWQL